MGDDLFSCGRHNYELDPLVSNSKASTKRLKEMISKKLEILRLQH